MRLLGVEEASELLPALRAARVVVVPGRICHPRSADPSFRCGAAQLRWGGCDTQQAWLAAVASLQIAFQLGQLCFAAARRCPYVRLAFSHPPAESLEEGVRRLGAVLRQAQAERQQQAGGGGA